MSAKLLVVEPRAEMDKSVIETLAEALKQAKEGRVCAVGIALVRPNGAVNTCNSETDRGPALLGAIEILKIRTLHGMDENILRGDV